MDSVCPALYARWTMGALGGTALAAGIEGGARLLLRAELHHSGGVVFAHTVQLSDRTLTIACNELLRADAPVRVVLSFPRLVAPFELTGRVASYQPDAGPGQEACAIIEITSIDDSARATLTALLEVTGRRKAVELVPPPYRCLLVEDNNLLRDLFAYGMDRYRHTRRTEVVLELAEDAEQAWRMLQAERYDMAIIDHYLPVESGAQLIARLRADASFADMPVVAISVGGTEAREAVMSAGADLFLDKPIVMRDLFSTLDRLTGPREAP